MSRSGSAEFSGKRRQKPLTRGETLKPSGRGELEITDVNNHYLKRGRLGYSILDGYWTDAGTLDSLDLANELVRKEPPRY